MSKPLICNDYIFTNFKLPMYKLCWNQSEIYKLMLWENTKKKKDNPPQIKSNISKKVL